MLPCNFLKTKLKACIFKKSWPVCKLPCLLLCSMAMEKTGRTPLAGMWSPFPWLAASAVSSPSLGFWIPGWCFATAAIVLPSSARFVPLPLSVKFTLLTSFKISLKR